MVTQNYSATLYILGDRGQTVDGSANDVRGRQVKNGGGIGKVPDLLVDDQQEKVRFLLVEHGGFLGFSETKSSIPVDAVTKITQDDVLIDQSRERVAAAPGYGRATNSSSPNLVDDRQYPASTYSHHGYTPYWGAGYMYPAGMAMLPISSPVSQN